MSWRRDYTFSDDIGPDPDRSSLCPDLPSIYGLSVKLCAALRCAKDVHISLKDKRTASGEPAGLVLSAVAAITGEAEALPIVVRVPHRAMDKPVAFPLMRVEGDIIIERVRERKVRQLGAISEAAPTRGRPGAWPAA